MQYMKALILDGFIGEPYIFNGFEQNSQFISPDAPVTKPDLIPTTESEAIRVSSLEGYGAPIIDLSLWFMDSELKSVVGTMHNFVPYRTNMDGVRVRTNIDDGDVYIGEYASGGFCTIQSSYVTVNSYPGLEARAYGSKGALICRLGAELEGQEVLYQSTSANAAEVAYVPVDIPDRFFPPGSSSGDPWDLVRSNRSYFMQEIISGRDRIRAILLRAPVCAGSSTPSNGLSRERWVICTGISGARLNTKGAIHGISKTGSDRYDGFGCLRAAGRLSVGTGGLQDEERSCAAIQGSDEGEFFDTRRGSRRRSFRRTAGTHRRPSPGGHYRYQSESQEPRC
jgi:hypothetical protein